MSEHELKCPLAEGYACIFPKCIYAGDAEFRQECWESNASDDDALFGKPMPDAVGVITSEEQQLLDVWRQNNCEDATCRKRRMDAALKVLNGGKTHVQYAKLIEEAVRDGK